MHTPKIKTYSLKKQITAFEIYSLCKGLNSGKPLDKPCPNCFVIVCKNEIEKNFYNSLLFGLWKGKYFEQYLTGSVIPFLRIGDFKAIVNKQAAAVSKNEKAFLTDVTHIKRLEEKQKIIQQQIQLINDLKRAILQRHLKS